MSTVVDRDFWHGKKVFMTGHTGFKGSWLSLWLEELGAAVHGFALEPPTKPSFFVVAKLCDRVASHTEGDIRDATALHGAIQRAQPEIVLHLAAQSLVRPSYVRPLETYSVNVMGTANLLEAVRHTPSVRAVIIVTSDKCYENREWVWPYREHEPLGGTDPYSSSKACAELVAAAYRSSFMSAAGIPLASARAGNVIGGGDWAADRLIPDFLRAFDARQVLNIRSPDATRPWQHVLEPLAGYLRLAEDLCGEGGMAFAEAWNFGPVEEGAKPVRWIVETLCHLAPEARWRCDSTPQPHEAHKLSLDSTKARMRLGWQPRWNLPMALERTLEWHMAWRGGMDMAEFSLDQIRAYQAERTLEHTLPYQ